jgi:hypothetical protein
MKAVEMRSLAEIVETEKVEAAVAALAERRNARRARLPVGMEAMVAHLEMGLYRRLRPGCHRRCKNPHSAG